MKKLKLRKSLYWRLSMFFLVMLIILGLAYVLITSIAANKYYQETTQRLNAHVAEHMLLEVSPFVDGKVNDEALGKIMHSMMAVNPSLEVYLLDPSGEILSFVVLDKKVRLNSVDLKPVKEFIETKGQKFILGDDPRNPGGNTIFSATKVEENGKLMGYIYMVLQSEEYENITSTLWGSYWLKVGTRTFILTLVAALAIGLFIIWMLTKNLRIVIQTFRKFQNGDLNARIPEKSAKGELKELSLTFNQMADSILENIEELKKVDSLRRELIANVSHDLRNPLAVIHGYIETLLLKNTKLSEEERTKYLEIILNSSEKLKKLVSDLFELSKLEAKQLQPKKEPFFINELVNDAAQSIKLLAKEKNIVFNSDISISLPMVNADIAMMERVIQNLLDNAVKYTPEKGEIRLEVQEKGNHVNVKVDNTGKGIPPSEIPHIFSRYYKIGKENSDIGGHGLGLAIVKKILDLHEAPIIVESKENQITTFMFELPIYKSN